MRKAVESVSGALFQDIPSGVIAQCEWGNNDPKENVAEVFSAWNDAYVERNGQR